MRVFAAASRDIKNVKESSSGGVFFELCKEIILRKGVVFGVVQSDVLTVCHERASTEKDVQRFRKSKYIRSDNCQYGYVKEELQNDKWVLFSGTGCQIGGLYKFLKKQYSKLLTVEVVCHGMPLKEAYVKYIQEEEMKRNTKMTEIVFRDKRFGWKKNAICEKYDNGESCVILSEEHPHHYLYLCGINMDTGCGYCKYAKLPRVADITLADFWSYSGDEIPHGEENGISLVVTTSKKGDDFFETVQRDLYVSEVTTDIALSSCKHLSHSPALHVNQKAFRKLISMLTYETAAKLCMQFGRVAVPSDLCVIQKEDVKKICNRLFENGQEIIYLADEDGTVEGIVTMGAFIEGVCQNKGIVNHSFQKILIDDEDLINNIKDIFNNNEKINRIPIVDKNNKLLFEVSKNDCEYGKDDDRRFVLPFILMKSANQKMFFFRRPAIKEDYNYTHNQLRRMQKKLSFPYMFEQLDAYEADLKEIMGNNYSREYIADVSKVSVIVKKNDRYCHADQAGRLVNIINGERIVCHQPEEYVYTIHIYGRCGVFGYAVEDADTLPSKLQSKLCDLPVRVVSHSTWGAEDGFIFHNLMKDLVEGIVLEHDIVLLYMGDIPYNDIARKLGLYIGDTTSAFHNMLKKKQVDFYDIPGHMNAAGYGIIADYIYNELKGDIEAQRLLAKNRKSSGRLYKGGKEDRDKGKEIYDYLSEQKELVPYEKMQNMRVGAAVMNCNPYTKGHRYLIETAASREDVFLVFVVEENKSSFSFQDRFNMVKAGTCDLKNVYVIPSGRYILSSYTMPEYFFKEQEKTRVVDMSMDLGIFADYIAPFFNIRRRYVGTEPYDSITKIYNREQKRILNNHGIEVIEIERIKRGGEYISASKVREIIGGDNDNDLCDYLPESTIKYIRDNRLDELFRITNIDDNGNKSIIAKDAKLGGCIFNWAGYNAIIEIEEGFSADNLVINIHSGAHIRIGRGVEIHRCKWDLYQDASFVIEDGVSWGFDHDAVPWGDGSETIVFPRGNVVIGRDTHLNKNALMIVYSDTLLSIGSNSMFSRNVTIRTGDGHRIIDKKTKKQVNTSAGNVIIGNHVWLNEHVKILANTDIGSGTVIGANSVIKGIVPGNCVFVGVAGQGRVIKDNIIWER